MHAIGVLNQPSHQIVITPRYLAYDLYDLIKHYNRIN